MAQVDTTVDLWAGSCRPSARKPWKIVLALITDNFFQCGKQCHRIYLGDSVGSNFSPFMGQPKGTFNGKTTTSSYSPRRRPLQLFYCFHPGREVDAAEVIQDKAWNTIFLPRISMRTEALAKILVPLCITTCYVSRLWPANALDSLKSIECQS